jgi:restriction endonuclease S subunit
MGQAPPSKECNFSRLGTPFVKVGEFGSSRPVIREWTTNPLKLAKRSDVLLYVVGATCGKINLGEDCAIGRSVAAIRPNAHLLDQMYLYYFTTTMVMKMRNGSQGAAQTVISKEMIQCLRLPLPPLAEQQRIVAILDEAFAGLAVAAANTEKNLKNAREVFESYLSSVFVGSAGDWDSYSISEVATKIGSGATPRGGQESYKLEGVPLIRSMNVHDRRFKFDDLAFLDDEQARKLGNVIVEDGDVLLNITGASVARCCRVPASLASSRVNQHVAIIRPIQSRIVSRFLEFSLTAKINKDRLLGVGEKGGSTRQAITKAEIESFRVSFPTISTQNEIVAFLDDLNAQTIQLEAINRQKLAAIAELKQSLLQKAFAGELTKDFQPSFPASAAASKVSNLSSANLHAGILAVAYDRHHRRGTHKTFGRVKAQKFLHLVESVGRIDLGRVPIKDAAGPNDFQHMLNAEKWARQNSFFEFAPRPSGNGYEFKKLQHFDEQLKQSIVSLEPFRAELNKVIDLIIDMNSEEAELFATVHAAWNNIMIDKKPIIDQAIVHEARENWHKDKLKIPEQRFHNALNSIRTRKVEPDGAAKYVGGQSRLI